MNQRNNFGPGARRLFELCHIPLEQVGGVSTPDNADDWAPATSTPAAPVPPVAAPAAPAVDPEQTVMVTPTPAATVPPAAAPAPPVATPAAPAVDPEQTVMVAPTPAAPVPPVVAPAPPVAAPVAPAATPAPTVQAPAAPVPEPVVNDVEQTQMATQPNAAPEYPDEPAKKNNTLLYVLLAVLAVLVLGGGGYFAYQQFGANDDKTEKVEDEEAEEEIEAEEEVAEEAEEENVPTAYIDYTFNGQIGGYDNCSMVLEKGVGYVDGLNLGRRTISVFEWNEYTGQLVLDAYLNGEYIGQYEGTVERNEFLDVNQYTGIFRNAKTGGKVDFNLSEPILDGDGTHEYMDYDDYDDYDDDYDEPWI